MGTYGEKEIPLNAFLISALDGGEWLASSPVRFTLYYRRRIGD
jgi:hypothetical protein